IQQLMGLTEQEKIFFVKRLRNVNNEPYILEESFLPFHLFPDLSADIMKKSLYEHLENKGYKIKGRKSELIPVMPDQDTKKRLQIEGDVPVLLMKNFSMLENDMTFEHIRV